MLNKTLRKNLRKSLRRWLLVAGLMGAFAQPLLATPVAFADCIIPAQGDGCPH